MQFIVDYRPLFEFIYFLTGPLMIVGVIVGILQLHLFKKEASTRFQRETILLTLSQLEHKCEKLEEFQKRLWRAENEQSTIKFSGKVESFYYDGIACTNNWLVDIKSNKGKIMASRAVDMLNQIEFLSHYIFSGITDEDLCYNSQGAFILTRIENNKHYIALLRSSENDEAYEGIVELYERWRSKANYIKLALQHEEIVENLNKSNSPNPITVIGGKV